VNWEWKSLGAEKEGKKKCASQITNGTFCRSNVLIIERVYATFYCGLFSAESAFQMDLKLRAIRAHSLGTSLCLWLCWYERILNRALQHTFMRALLTHMVGTHKYSVCMPSLTHSVAHYSQKRPPRRWAAHMHKLFPKINFAWQENLLNWDLLLYI
jgi:hypothetical protein